MAAPPGSSSSGSPPSPSASACASAAAEQCPSDMSDARWGRFDCRVPGCGKRYNSSGGIRYHLRVCQHKGLEHSEESLQQLHEARRKDEASNRRQQAAQERAAQLGRHAAAAAAAAAASATSPHRYAAFPPMSAPVAYPRPTSGGSSSGSADQTSPFALRHASPWNDPSRMPSGGLPRGLRSTVTPQATLSPYDRTERYASARQRSNSSSASAEAAMDALFASVRCGGSGPRAGGMNPTHTNHDDSFVDASSVVEHAVRLSQAFEHATRGAYTTADGRSSPSSIGSMLSGSTASLSASASAAGSMTSLPTRCSTTSPITPRGGSAAAGVGHLTSPMRRLDIARPARGSDASRNASAAALTPTDQERHRFYWAHSGGGNSGAGATAADRDVLAAAAASPLPQYSQASGAAQRPGSGQCTFADFTLHGGSNSNSSDDLNSSLDSRNGGGSLGFSASPSRHSHTSPAARRRFPVEGTDASLRSPADVAAHPRPPVLGVLPHTSHAQSEATPRHLLAAAAAQQQGRHPLHDQDLRQPLYHLRRHHPSSSPSTEQNGPFAPPLSAEHPPLSRPFPMWIERETSESQHGRGTDQRSRSTHEHQHDPHLRQEQPDDDSTRWLSPLRQPQTASCTPSHGQSQSQSQVQAQSQSRPHSAHRCTGYGSPQSPYATATVSPRGGAGLLSAPASISSPSRRRAQRHSVSGHMPSLHELEEARPETPPKRHRVTGHEQHPPDFAHLLHHQQASAASPCLPHLSDIDSASDFDLAAMDDVFLSPGMMSTSSHVDSASVCGGSATDSTPSGNACYASAVVAAATVSTPSSTSPGGDSRHGQHGEHMERGGGGLDPFGLSLGLLATSSSASAASTGTAAQQQHAHELFMELSDDDLATLQQELNMSPAAGSNHSSPTRRQPPSVSRHSDAGLGVPASFGWGQEVYAPVQNKEQLPPILAPLSSASNTQPMSITDQTFEYEL